MDNEILFSALRKLKSAGTRGFEGLVAKLVQKLTGRRFFLARSGGSQGGRDMSTAGLSGNIIAVECKRFLEDTKLKTDEIIRLSW